MTWLPFSAASLLQTNISKRSEEKLSSLQQGISKDQSCGKYRKTSNKQILQNSLRFFRILRDSKEILRDLQRNFSKEILREDFRDESFSVLKDSKNRVTVASGKSFWHLSKVKKLSSNCQPGHHTPYMINKLHLQHSFSENILISW